MCVEVVLSIFLFFVDKIKVTKNGAALWYPAGIWYENDVVLTSMRRDYVASTLIRRHFDTKCPLGINYSAPQVKAIHLKLQCD